MSEEVLNSGMVPEGSSASVSKESDFEGNQGGEYDNEWVRYLSTLSKDDSRDLIVSYIETVELTDKARNRLKVYIGTLFDKEFATSLIRNENDSMKLMDDKNLLDADLYLGLTRFDLTPEFHHIVNLIRIKWGIKTRRSYRGFERIAIYTQRGESVTEERMSDRTKQGKGLTNKIRGVFGGE